MHLQIIPGRFAVGRLDHVPPVPDDDFWFLSRTDKEVSLVCRSESVPGDCLRVENDWRMLRVEGALDFALVGILAELSGVLARAGVSLFALSTYDTDYILVKEKNFEKAVQALRDAGHEARERNTL